MKINFTLFVTLFLILVVVHCADTDLEVKKGSENGLGQKSHAILNKNNNSNEKSKGLDSDVGSKKVDPLKKGKEQVDDSKQGDQNTNLDKKDPSKQLGHKEAEKVQTKENETKTVKGGDKKENADKGSGSKDKDSVLPSTSKENVRGEECDSSNKCTDDVNALIACLRVPGNESPELSLLIQNKGNSSINVKITAPNFVHLEKTTIQLQEKEGTEVKVSIRGGKTDKLIVLNAGNGDCSLDFRDLVAHNPVKEADSTSQFTYINLFRRTPFLGFIFLAALLAIASILVCVSFQRKRFQSTGVNSKYQKLDIELPVSGPTQTGTDLKDESGWEDSWSDNWDDVEAPMTPSMPVTPSLSSKGFNSRRVSKEGWKD